MSKKAKFTDGDWISIGPFIRHEKTGADICLLNSSNKTEQEYNANTNLILAAPKMYHALKAITQYLSEYVFINDVPEYQQAISALQKADGE